MFRKFSLHRPRFGLIWIVPAMLFVVSAAGWWKFHLELYLQERDAVAALKESGGKVSFRREDPSNLVMQFSQEHEGVPWNAPLYAPIQHIMIREEPSDAARDAALRLPRLKLYLESVPPPSTSRLLSATHRLPASRNVETLMGRPLPPPETAELKAEALDEPLPEGEPLDAAEADRVAAAIFAAWRSPDASPPRRLVVGRALEERGMPTQEYGWLQVDLIEPDRSFQYVSSELIPSRGRASTFADDRYLSYEHNEDGWRRDARRMDFDESKYLRHRRQFPADDYPYYASDFNGDDPVHQAVQNEDSLRFQRVAKVDDVRYRIDFAPFEAPLDETNFLNDLPPRVTEWSCVVRADFDWAPESSKMVQERFQGGRPMRTLERRVVQRFRRDGGYVSLAERLSRDTGATRFGVPDMRHTVHDIELDPTYEDRVFDPLSIDPKPWAERRSLPVWRWYRVTFALGCALTAFLAGSRLVEAFRRRPASESASAEAAPES